ncbi:UNVERIFIED_CONTAM: hypothetical protein FKN15_069928 [Acipenser sinensis]
MLLPESSFSNFEVDASRPPDQNKRLYDGCALAGLANILPLLQGAPVPACQADSEAAVAGCFTQSLRLSTEMDESTFETFEGDIGPEEGLEELPAPGEILPKTTKQLRNQGAQIAKTSKGESSGVSREVEGFQTVEQELVQAQEAALPSNPPPAKEKAKPEAITSDDEVSDPEPDLLSWSDSNPEEKTEQSESSFFGSLMWWSWVPEEEDSEEAAAGGRRSESRRARALGRRDQEQEAGGRGRAEKHRVRHRAEGIRELLKSKEEKKGGHDKAGRKHEEKPPKQREQKQAEHKRSEQKRDEGKRREDSDDDKKSGSKGNRMSLLADKGMPKKERSKYQLKGGKRND